VLLGDDVLTVPDRVARVWRHREATEREAAALFRGLAVDLRAGRAGAALVALAERAAADEERHALRCRDIARRFGPDLAAEEPRPPLRLGPPHLDRARRALYASAALSCVTETLSAALLLEMRAQAADPLVRETVREILCDEVNHARLGWAHLAHEARRGDVGWLALHVPGMLRAALRSDVIPHTAADEGARSDLAAFGILPRAAVLDILRQVAADVLFPGLEQHGIDTAPLRAEVASFGP